MISRWIDRRIFISALLQLATTLGCLDAGAQQPDKPLRVVATVPDLGSLAQDIGGDRVTIAVIAKGGEDPHFIEAKPSFVKLLSEADLYIQVGLELEAGWAPVLLQNARNGRILPGAPGYVDASTVITPLDVPTGPVDRSMGDVHPFGSPHYLLDPLQGLKVARLIRDTLTHLRLQDRGYFEERYAAFRQRMAVALVGEKLAKRYDFEKLALLYERGGLGAFLKAQGEQADFGGWLGTMLPYYGSLAVADHNAWSYFARRFGLKMVGALEPKPGIPPTTQHLGRLIEQMRAQKVPIVIAVVYYDPRHAQTVSQKTGARVVNLAHIVGARSGTNDYISMVDYNVKQVASALSAGG
jgi:ABC-type Zn uptake system ZnuABC Zn-binding protein ZnuA